MTRNKLYDKMGEIYFKKGTKLGKNLIVLKSGYSIGKYKYRAIGMNIKTKEKQYAT